MIIDGSTGQAVVFVANFERYRVWYTEEFATLEEALKFLFYGTDECFLYIQHVADGEGNVVMDKDTLFDCWNDHWELDGGFRLECDHLPKQVAQPKILSAGGIDLLGR